MTRDELRGTEVGHAPVREAARLQVLPIHHDDIGMTIVVANRQHQWIEIAAAVFQQLRKMRAGEQERAIIFSCAGLQPVDVATIAPTGSRQRRDRAGLWSCRATKSRSWSDPSSTVIFRRPQ